MGNPNDTNGDTNIGNLEKHISNISSYNAAAKHPHIINTNNSHAANSNATYTDRTHATWK
eukprot:5619035-Pyramimonas_sp.AAC.1